MNGASGDAFLAEIKTNGAGDGNATQWPAAQIIPDTPLARRFEFLQSDRALCAVHHLKESSTMATASKPTAPKKAIPASKKGAAAPRKAAAAKVPTATLAALKPIKTAFNKTTLQAHLAEVAGVEPKAVKAVMSALEATMVASLNKKGLGEFTLPGLLKITAQAVPAKKKRRGIDPFTKVEREFAAKPASVRVKVRSLKKIKDAAL